MRPHAWAVRDWADSWWWCVGHLMGVRLQVWVVLEMLDLIPLVVMQTKVLISHQKV